jgi:hypothetical protein
VDSLLPRRYPCRRADHHRIRKVATFSREFPRITCGCLSSDYERDLLTKILVMFSPSMREVFQPTLSPIQQIGISHSKRINLIVTGQSQHI